MQQKHIWITLPVGAAYVIAAMWIMLYAAMNRVVMIEDVTQEQMPTESMQESGQSGKGTWKNLTLSAEKGQGKDIVIPVEEGLKAEQVTIKNHYLNKEIWIGFDGVEKNYFDQKSIAGNLASVEEAVYGKQEGLLWLRFKVDGIYECKSILENGHLCITLENPKELYETVAVIDACYYRNTAGAQTEGMTDREITADITRRLEEKLKAEGAVKVYYIGVDGEEPSAEERVQFVKEAGADLYIGIGLNESTDASVYGVETIYNGTYFLPGFGNVELADCLTKNVTKQVSGRANGLTEAKEEDMIVQKAQIPAVILQAGYLSNAKEAELLNRGEYRDRIAEGIFQTVREANEKMKNEETE